MNWNNLWMQLFGVTELWGISMSFWIALSVVALLVVAMNVIFWSLKPKVKPLRKSAQFWLINKKSTVKALQMQGFFTSVSFSVKKPLFFLKRPQ